MARHNTLRRCILAPLLIAPLFLVTAGAQTTSTISTGGAGAQTTSTNSALDRVRIDVVPPISSGATPGEGPPDPLSYCYFANKSYSMGAKLNGQVCVRPKDEPGVVSSAPAPLKWVSAARFARGQY